MHAEVEAAGLARARSAASWNQGHGTMIEPQVAGPLRERLEAADVRGVTHPEVVDVDDRDALARREAEALGQAASLRAHGTSCRRTAVWIPEPRRPRAAAAPPR